jgi:hypothetical protein
LPLNDATSTTNMLRLFKGLDLDHTISNGVQLMQVSTATASNPITPINFTSESSVASTLVTLAPSATLPSATDTEVVAAKQNALTTAANNRGAFGAVYKGNHFAAGIMSGSSCASPRDPKAVSVNFASQPAWGTGTVNGTITMTLNDNSAFTFPITSAAAATPYGGSYMFVLDNFSQTRTFIMLFSSGRSNVSSPVGNCAVRLIDESQPNVPPVPFVSEGRCTVPVPPDRTTICTLKATPPLDPMMPAYGSPDQDGHVVSQTWTSSKGTTGTGNTFTESCQADTDDVSITLTAVDNEGAKSSTTFRMTAQCAGLKSPPTSGTTPTTPTEPTSGTLLAACMDYGSQGVPNYCQNFYQGSGTFCGITTNLLSKTGSGCPTTDRVGACDVPYNGKLYYTEIYYSYGGLRTAASAREQCSLTSGGVWVP